MKKQKVTHEAAKAEIRNEILQEENKRNSILEKMKEMTDIMKHEEEKHKVEIDKLKGNIEKAGNDLDRFVVWDYVEQKREIIG